MAIIGRRFWRLVGVFVFGRANVQDFCACVGVGLDFCNQVQGNAMHAVRTQCKVLDVGKYSNPSFGPFSQVFGSVPGFFWLPKHLGCGIFELSTISP